MDLVYSFGRPVIFLLPILVAIHPLYSFWKKWKTGGATSNSWELSLLFLLFLTEVIVISLAINNREITNQIERIESKLEKQTSEKELVVSDQQEQIDVSTLISAKIAANNPSSIQRIVRHLCVPISLPGDVYSGDSVVGESFRQFGIDVTYILSIPSRDLAASNKELENVRKRTLLYLFKLLTSKFWVDPQVSGFSNLFHVLVLQNTCATSSWDAKIGSDYIGGVIGYDSKWMEINKLPAQQFYVSSKDAKFTSSLAEDHDYEEIMARHFMNLQFNSKNEWEREPWAIFPMTDGISLKPMPLTEIIRKIDQVEKKWIQEDATGKRREHPIYLKELIYIRDGL